MVARILLIVLVLAVIVVAAAIVFAVFRRPSARRAPLEIPEAGRRRDPVRWMAGMVLLLLAALIAVGYLYYTGD